MYVRKKNNRSGSTSVVVVVKHNGRYKEIKSFGSSYDDSEIERLVMQAKQWIVTFEGQQQLDFDDKRLREREETERVVGNLDALLINGTQLLLGRIYDEIGFNAIKDEVLRHLVIARLTHPCSKLATVEYLTQLQRGLFAMWLACSGFFFLRFTVGTTDFCFGGR